MDSQDGGALEAPEPAKARGPSLWRNPRRVGGASLVVVAGTIAVVLWIQAYGIPFVSGGSGSSSAGGSGTPLPSPPPPVTLVSNGSRWSIAPGSHESVPIQLPYEFSLYGTFSASAPMLLYLMDDGQYGAWLNGTDGSPPATDWTAGPEHSGWVNAFDDEGSYELVFQNTNATTIESVTITSTITATLDSS